MGRFRYKYVDELYIRIVRTVNKTLSTDSYPLSLLYSITLSSSSLLGWHGTVGRYGWSNITIVSVLVVVVLMMVMVDVVVVVLKFLVLDDGGGGTGIGGTTTGYRPISV